MHPVGGRKLPYSSAWAPSAQIAAGRSRIGTRKAYRCGCQRTPRDILTDPPPAAASERIVYGPEPLQFADVRNAGPRALAVVFHGGSWKATHNLTHLAHLCILLGENGIPTLNVEYRRVGDPGGGWPGSLTTSCSQSSGRRRLPATRARRPLGGRTPRATRGEARGLPVVALAAVCDPPTWENDAVAAFFAGEAPTPEASPLAQAPAGVPHDRRPWNRRRRRPVRAIAALRRRRPATRRPAATRRRRSLRADRPAVPGSAT